MEQSVTERGVYNNVQRGKQLLRFDGFRYGNITPTDIDGVIEYQNRIWLLYEAKLTGKDVPHGQRLALERWIADAGKAGTKQGNKTAAKNTKKKSK